MERSQSEAIKNQDQLIEIMVNKKTLGGGIEKCMKEGGLPYGVRSSISQPGVFLRRFHKRQECKAETSRISRRSHFRKKITTFQFYLRWSALNRNCCVQEPV